MSSSTSMKAYLAAHYMSGAKAEAITARLDPTVKKKKKKSKTADANAASSASFIKDMDEDLRWGKPVEEEEDEEERAVVEKDRSFKKRRVEPASQANDGGGWISVQGGDDEGAAVEEMEMEETTTAPPAAGLVMPSQFKSALPQAPEKTKKKKAKRTDGDYNEDGQGETVYRDASGRKIQVESAEDIAARQAEEEREKLAVQRMKKEWQKGLVQREQAESRRLEEQKERTKGVARHADDKELNDVQKTEERWNDPAAAFLTKKEKKGPKRPEYKGPPPPPNRFGIKPGYRWDGVDRSNGFEKKYFQTINERGRTKLEAYQWSVDDM